MSRAFKPMPVVLDLVYENFSEYKNLIFFMGKRGKKVFEDSKNVELLIKKLETLDLKNHKKRETIER